MVTKEDVLEVYRKKLEDVANKFEIAELRKVISDEDASKTFWAYYDYDGSLEKIDLDFTMRSYIFGLKYGCSIGFNYGFREGANEANRNRRR